MLRVALIARSTLYTSPGGDSIQIKETAKHLCRIGVVADIRLTNEIIDYTSYDLLHFFNIIRPADILRHINTSKKPFVVSPILVDYSEYDKLYRKGISGMIFQFLPARSIEYLKIIARWIMKKDQCPGLTYLLWGHKKSMKSIIRKAQLLLPNSESEQKRLHQFANQKVPYIVVPNGVNTDLFTATAPIEKNDLIVLCVGRIEGIKNQLNLIKALNHTEFTLILIGSPAKNQTCYYEECKQIAAHNIQFLNHIPQEDLISYYCKAKVHILPSWFETCGLSSLEAAAMGCNIAISDKGYVRDYFGEYAFYCDPSSQVSIIKAVRNAAKSAINPDLEKRVRSFFTWQKAAAATLQAYQTVLNK